MATDRVETWEYSIGLGEVYFYGKVIVYKYISYVIYFLLKNFDKFGISCTYYIYFLIFGYNFLSNFNYVRKRFYFIIQNGCSTLLSPICGNPNKVTYHFTLTFRLFVYQNNSNYTNNSTIIFQNRVSSLKI